jgi:hypothetical protein
MGDAGDGEFAAFSLTGVGVYSFDPNVEAHRSAPREPPRRPNPPRSGTDRPGSKSVVARVVDSAQGQ